LIATPTETTMKPHWSKGRVSSNTRGYRVPLKDRRFIAWDGEGVNIAGVGAPQSYVLFGCSEGHISNVRGLTTFDCLDFILAVGTQNPGSIHVGFAFTYDANMIMQSLSPVTLARLHRHGYARLRRKDGQQYAITFTRGKFFRVTKYLPGYDRKTNPSAKHTVQIFDVFSFFACSFVKAYTDLVGPIPESVDIGKANRPNFTVDDMDKITDYWSVEVQLIRELAEELRKRVYNAGLYISQWHGPGALASYAMKEHNVKQHMADTPPQVKEAARYAYAAGRFELYKCGRVTDTVYGIDRNSAYPYALTKLPSLSEGTWRYVRQPSTLVSFGVYHVVLRKGGGFTKQPSPLFHRDRNHNLSFPWFADGWYWTPEAYFAQRMGATLVEGWEYVGWSTYPFGWINDTYTQRRDWKRRGISAQLALKLMMNSITGKAAQRVGWDEEKQRIPVWHQLEWAGYVTSYTRAGLFSLMVRIPFDKLISIETDGIYTTMSPEELGITHDDELGGWSVSSYQEVLYVQSGLAWLLDFNGEWSDKRRGLDQCKWNHNPSDCDCPGVFSLNACREYLRSLHPRPNGSLPWLAYSGQTTRFVGLGQALASSIPTKMRHCVWETNKREILPGHHGKRVHFPGTCAACKQDASAFELAHDLVINSRSIVDPRSYPHSLPWIQDDNSAEWREYSTEQDGYVSLGGY
jgi:hypothetical protein